MNTISNKNIKDCLPVFKIIQKFKRNKNINVAYNQLLKDICEVFNFQRTFSVRRNNLNDQYLPIIEYIKDKGVNIFNDDIYFNVFVDINTSNNVNENEEKLLDLINEKYLFTKEELPYILPVLNSLGYVEKENINLEQIVIFPIYNKDLFCYSVLEKYSSEKITNEELFILETIYDVVSMQADKAIFEKRVETEKNMKEAIINNEQMPICMVEQENHTIVYFNELYKKILPNVKIGENCFNLFGKYAPCDICCTEAVRLQNHLEVNDKYWIKKSVPFKLGNMPVYMIYAKDTSDYIKQLEGIDLLTSAFSMTGFYDYLNRTINSFHNYSFYLCTIDIDKFKYINDYFGFTIGNKILKKFAEVIRNFVQKPENFGRINEDKFAILLNSNSQEEVSNRINYLFKQLEKMQQEHFLDTKLTFVAGVTKVNLDTPANILLDYANFARKSVKGSHKSTLAFFDEKIEQKAREDAKLEKRIAYAVENNEFVPFLQPKFELSTNKICGAEALVRWITPEGMIYPDQFIPLFEKDGFIITLDFIVYKQIMIHIRECLDEGLPVYPISLNVSRNHIQNKNFVDQIMDLMNEYEIPVYLLELEVTESVFVEDREILKYFIDNIKRPKIKVSIDDFGTAYSSLQILKDIDIDILKIDKGFLENIDFTDKHQFTKDEVVLKNIINLAKDLNCKVICEGIETKEQVKLLSSIGCEFGQGYIFAKPMPISDYKKYFLQ